MSALYPTKEEAAVVAAAEKLMVETMARYDPSHDAHHVQRVRKTALQLARALPDSDDSNEKKPGPDLLTVELAALLHDVLDKKYVSAEAAADPYAFFLPFFEAAAAAAASGTGGGLDLVRDGRARAVARIVDNVSWSTEKKRLAAGEIEDWHRECVELHCVQDADRLDAIGAFGVLRCAAYSAATNRTLHVSREDPDYDSSAVAHFYDKLLHIRERLKTEPGKRLAEKRHQLMLDFLASVDEEYDVRI